MTTSEPHQSRDPLHGVTLAALLEHLVNVYGWDELGARINIRCFQDNPSLKSSLTFLRKTEWARKKVERLYLSSLRYKSRFPPSGSAVAVEGRDSNDELEPN